MASTRRETGMQLLHSLEGEQKVSILDSLRALSSDLADLTVDFAYGDVYARPGLTIRQRQLVTIGALTALGNARPQLIFHVRGALSVGCSPREIIEAIIHVIPFAGFPAGLNATFAAKEAFVAAGIDSNSTLTHVKDADVVGDRYAAGMAALAKIDGEAGERVIRSLADIAPDLGRFIIEFTFGDIYTRTGLDLHSRQIVTVAALAALGTAGPQLQVHTHAMLNVGGTEQELVEIAIQTAVYAGFPAALNAIREIREALKS